MATLVTLEHVRRVLVIRCHGDLDLAVAPELDRALTNLTDVADVDDLTGTDAVVLDLAEVTFLDCTALRSLLALAMRCRRAGLRFLMCGLTGIVCRLAQALQLDAEFPIVADADEAVSFAETWMRTDRPPRIRRRPTAGVRNRSLMPGGDDDPGGPGWTA